MELVCPKVETQDLQIYHNFIFGYVRTGFGCTKMHTEVYVCDDCVGGHIYRTNKIWKMEGGFFRYFNFVMPFRKKKHLVYF